MRDPTARVTAGAGVRMDERAPRRERAARRARLAGRRRRARRRARRRRQKAGRREHRALRGRRRATRSKRACARGSRASARRVAGAGDRRSGSSTGSTRRRAASSSSRGAGSRSRPLFAVPASHRAPALSGDRARRRPAGTIRCFLIENRGDGLRGSAHGTPPVRCARGRHALRAHRGARGGDARRLRLETGRTHQIRIHLSESGPPDRGRARVHPRLRGPLIEAPRLMLHAAELGFVHPATSARCAGSCRCPTTCAPCSSGYASERPSPGWLGPQAGWLPLRRVLVADRLLERHVKQATMRRP